MKNVWALAMTQSECIGYGCRTDGQGASCDPCEQLARSTLLVSREPDSNVKGKALSSAAFRAFMKGIVWGRLRETPFVKVPTALTRYGYTGRAQVFTPLEAPPTLLFADLLEPN
jgi:hypothetical protein